MRELVILGVIFDSKLSWSKHVSSIASRAGQKLGALRKVANKLDIRGRANVYKAQVRSRMEYACLCWTSASSTTLSQLENIQRKALKIIGVNEATARTQLSIPSLTHRREVAAVTDILQNVHKALPDRPVQATPSSTEEKTCDSV